MTGIRSDRIVTPQGLFDGYVYIEGGKIVQVCAERKTERFYDFTGRYVAPGFIEMHTHGAGGHAFTESTPEEVAAGCNRHLAHGTTSIVPTVSAGPFDVMFRATENIEKAMRGGRTKANVLGAHLEGPYLSPQQCGAQCPSFITEPIEKEYKELVQRFKKSIVRWTYAPEKDKDGRFCRYLTDNGILASAGHTDATYDDMKVAVANGCNLVTHLYSCTSTVTRKGGFRRLGVIESTFLLDELYAEIIADGKHLPPELIRMIVKIKGADKVAAVTDSLEIADTDVTEGRMSGTDFIVEEGVCKLKDRSAFAGSVATADKMAAVLTEECGFPVTTAVEMLSTVPAKILCLNKGELSAGKDADIVVFDDRIAVSAVFVNGQKVY